MALRRDGVGRRAPVDDDAPAVETQLERQGVGVGVGRLVVGADNVVLSGNTDTFNTVDDIKGSLEEAEIFTSVTISTAVAAVAAEIMPGRPPVMATMTAIENEA